MTRRFVVLLACLVWFGVGCGGAYRVTYQRPSNLGKPTHPQTRTHHHGIGPLIVGGGGLFFLLNPMSPALIDYTGPVAVDSVCPNGFAEVNHSHSLGQNAGAAFLSWLLVVNWFHGSNVEWKCLSAKE